MTIQAARNMALVLNHLTSPATIAASPNQSQSQCSRSRVFVHAVSCPGRCEGNDDDAASESDVDRSPQSPRSPWQDRQVHLRLGSPGQRSHTFDAECSHLMAAAAADEQRWEGSPGSRRGSPLRYPTPPITELLYETTCDELVRVKDERDMLKSEVEVLKNQLKNRDSTLAMLSGYVSGRKSTCLSSAQSRQSLEAC